MNAPNITLPQYSCVIECFAEKAGISLNWALVFYRSKAYCLVCGSVSDMQCMSDEYLTDELRMEYREKSKDRQLKFCNLLD